MPDIKLGRLPDRTPVKLSIKLEPELHRRLGEYARFYQAEHGEEVALADLVPAILQSFLLSDRAFLRATRTDRSPSA